jgi:hypothetical protein
MPPGNMQAYKGRNKKQMHAENRKRRQALQQAEQPTLLWATHEGTRILPAHAADKSRPTHHKSMCPAGLAVEHPAAAMFMDWAQFGCPTKTGNCGHGQTSTRQSNGDHTSWPCSQRQSKILRRKSKRTLGQTRYG